LLSGQVKKYYTFSVANYGDDWWSNETVSDYHFFQVEVTKAAGTGKGSMPTWAVVLLVLVALLAAGSLGFAGLLVVRYTPSLGVGRENLCVS
jgi:hypothetical protein